MFQGYFHQIKGSKSILVIL